LVRKAQRTDDELTGKVGGLLIGCPRTVAGLNVQAIYLFIPAWFRPVVIDAHAVRFWQVYRQALIDKPSYKIKYAMLRSNRC